eukprot:496414_1
MSDETKESRQCNCNFSDCPVSVRIKKVLHQFHQIKDIQSQLQHNCQQLIHNILDNEQYSHIKLINDFHHIIYDHNVNDNAKQFNIFHAYLCENKNTLPCNIDHCESAKRYYNRQRTLLGIQNKDDTEENINDIYSLNLLCKMHTYFIHGHHTLQLTDDEYKSIQQTLNEYKEDDQDKINDKRIELTSYKIHAKSQHVSQITPQIYNTKYSPLGQEVMVNCAKIASILDDNGINIDENKLESIFRGKGYHKNNIVDDLCEILLKQNDRNIKLCAIFADELKCDEMNTRLYLYDMILHSIIQKEELNNQNFIKILQFTACKMYPNIKVDEIYKIAVTNNLSVDLFHKKSKAFMTSLKFSNTFKTISNWNKKQWVKIY